MHITILFGGNSFEHEISIVSAVTVGKILHPKYYIFCDANRDFYLIEKANMKSNYFSTGTYKKSKQLFFKNGGIYEKALFGDKKLDDAVVLNLIHGRDGEDGKIASLLELNAIDYIGPRLEASVLSYNKLLTKLYAKQVGVEVLEYEILDRHHKDVTLEFPLIVKPLRLGSSIGISIAKDKAQLDLALDIAFEFDEKAIVEPFVEGIKEYNLAGMKAQEYIFSIIEEPQKSEILDFDKKYLDFSRDAKVHEANLDEAAKESLRQNFIKIYENMFEGALIRCDFFIHENRVYLNEINPIPGSMANYLFEDFTNSIQKLSNALPKEQKIAIDYKYINNIQGAKSKASL
jgi:D-alanine-D-alanine ligase